MSIRSLLLRLFKGKRPYVELLYNRVLTHIPHNGLRLAFLRMLGLRAGANTYLFGGSELMAPEKITMAGNCHVGRNTLLDGRGGLTIGRNVVIAGRCIILTADHDPESPDFAGRLGAVAIEDRVWIGTRATVLKGVTLGTGAVVSAGAVVHDDVAPWTIVAGVPAKVVRKRSKEQTYEIDFGPTWY